VRHCGRCFCQRSVQQFALHHVSEETAKQCFTEWARVLRPNSRLLVSVSEGTGDMDMGLKPGFAGIVSPVDQGYDSGVGFQSGAETDV
jgi:hypothetical protein